MLPGSSGFPLPTTQQQQQQQQERMGNCVSSQSQAGAMEKQAASTRGRGLVAMRKAAMEKYPVPTKCRIAINDAAANRSTTTMTASSSTEAVNNGEQLAQLRSKLRPPSVSLTRPLSVQLQNSKMNSNGIADSNGNIPRPSSLPRPLRTVTPSSTSSVSIATEPNVASRIESLLLAKPQTTRPSTLPGRTCSLDSKNRTIVNPPPVSSMTSGSSSGRQSVSPSPSILSLSSSRSNSAADSGIALCSTSRSPSTVSEKTNKSAQSLKFGFFQSTRSVKPAAVVEVKKASVERINRLTGPKESPATNGSTKTTPLSSQTGSSYVPKFRQQARPPVAAKPVLVTSKTKQSASISNRTPTPHLVSIRNRAAQVLSRSRSIEYRPVPSPRPRLSVEAIVASLEQEIRHQLGPELPPLPPPVTTPSATSCTSNVDVVERFVVGSAEPSEPEKAFIQTAANDDEDFIEDIKTPSSLNSQHTPMEDGDGCRSRDEGHPNDEEDSNATSISDAMIDDEIADQPGLVMLGQSMSVPASPMRSWRSDMFHYAIPASSLVNYPPSEEEPAYSDTRSSSPYQHRFLGRRVASVNDIEGGAKESSGSAAEASTMRTELFLSRQHHSGGGRGWSTSSPESSILIDIEDYTAMANELADIKSQLVALQEILTESDVVNGALTDGSTGAVAPLWDLKRDLVLLREELQAKNVTIRTLKNELRAAGVRTLSRTKSNSTSCCNVATQTDRPRSGILSNGASPSENEDVQLVSTKTKLPTPTGLPIRSQPVRLTSK